MTGRTSGEPIGNSTTPGLEGVWYLAAGLAAAATAAVGVVLYPGLPHSLPVHWNGQGLADRYADKSFWTVFSVPLITAGLVLFLYATAVAVRRLPINNVAPFGVDEQVHQQAGKEATQFFLGLTTLDLSLLLSWLALRGWLLPPDGSALLFVLPTLAFLAAMAGAGLLARRRYRRLIAVRSGRQGVG